MEIRSVKPPEVPESSWRSSGYDRELKNKLFPPSPESPKQEPESQKKKTPTIAEVAPLSSEHEEDPIKKQAKELEEKGDFAGAIKVYEDKIEYMKKKMRDIEAGLRIISGQRMETEEKFIRSMSEGKRTDETAELIHRIRNHSALPPEVASREKELVAESQQAEGFYKNIVEYKGELLGLHNKQAAKLATSLDIAGTAEAFDKASDVAMSLGDVERSLRLSSKAKRVRALQEDAGDMIPIATDLESNAGTREKYIKLQNIVNGPGVSRGDVEKITSLLQAA